MKKGKHFNGKLTNKKIIIFILILIISVFMIIIRIQGKELKKDSDAYRKLANDHSGVEVKGNVKTERISKLEKLQEDNAEIIGWLQIDNSKINYPVLQGNDNSFYMTHDYQKTYSKNGSLFLDKDYNWNLPSTNLLIYGHNNRGSDEMFADLMNYKSEEYYKSHSKIRFTTNQEDAEYEIIAVFLSRVYYKNEKDVFRYYYFINAENEQEYNDYINGCKEASLYNIEATAKYGDQLITLSTCEFSQEDGRLAVVARKI